MNFNRKSVGKKFPIVPIYAAAALIFGLASGVMTLIHYIGSVWGTIQENYMLPMSLKTVFIFLGVSVLTYALLSMGTYFIPKRVSGFLPEWWSDKRFLVLAAVLLFLAWLPYYLSYYPGGIYSDTFASISMALGNGELKNTHPVIYTLMLRGVIEFFEGFGTLFQALAAFFALQMLAVEGTILYFIWWMLKHKLPKWLAVCSMIYLIFFPLVPLNAVSVWKDIPFSLAVLFYTLNLIDLYLQHKRDERSYGASVGCMVWGLLVILTRNNGIYIVVGTTVFYILATFRHYKNRRYGGVVYGLMILGILLSVVIEGPVYKSMGVKERNFTAFLGIPLQQVGRVVAYDGTITEEQKVQLERFMPYEEMKAKYVPCLTDSLKWDASFQHDYMNTHKKEFFQLWFELLLQNPKEYVKAYIMNTAGFWCLNVGGFDAYIQNYVWPNTSGIEQTDLFQKWFGFSFQNIVNPKKAISSAWYFWFLFFSMVICWKRFGFRTLAVYMPLFLVWATLMVATPIAVSMRYVEPLIFAAPLFVGIPLVMQRKEDLETE